MSRQLPTGEEILQPQQPWGPGQGLFRGCARSSSCLPLWSLFERSSLRTTGAVSSLTGRAQGESGLHLLLTF